MRTIAIAKKVIKELLRDKRTLALMFVAPVFIMWLMNLMFSASTTVTVKLATQDVPSSLVSKMDDLEHVSVKTYKDLDKAKEALNDEKVDAVISYKDGEYHVAYANTDASKTSVTRQVLRTSIASEDTNQLLARVKQSLPQLQLKVKSPEIKESYEYGNEDTGFFAKMIPVLLGFVVFFFVFLISGMALLKERTSGTLDRLLATPVKRSEIVYGYMLSYGLIAILQTGVVVLAAIWLLNIEVVGSLLNVIIVNVVLALVALAFGILLSTLAKSEFQMMQFIPLVIMPQLFFSGIIPLDSMGDWAKMLGKFLPLTYSGDAMSQIILYGRGLGDILPNIGVLLVFLVALTKGADYPKGKKKIMQAAVDLISTKSYNGTSTLQIAKHAGLSQATLFKYFKTKEDLLTAILHPVVPGLFGRFFEELLALETTEEKVHYLVQNRMAYLKTNRALMKIILQEIFSNKKLRKEQLYIWNTLQDKLLVLHKELIADSRVNPEITVPQMIRICIGPLLAYFAQLYIVGDNSDIREEDLNLLEKQILGGLWK